MLLHVIQIDLTRKLEIDSKGYDHQITLFHNNRMQVVTKKDLPQHTCYINGVFYHAGTFETIENGIRDFVNNNNPEFFNGLDGEFSIVIWDKERSDITIVSDKSGTQKIFYNCASGVVTITSRLTDQALLQSRPAFSEYGVYTALSISYTQDPYTFLNDTWATRIGEIVRINANGSIDNRFYYKPVKLDFKGYSTITESVNELDSSLKNYFRSRVSSDTVPLVMLSGGIDSVVMMSYINDIPGAGLNSLTFAIKGSPSNELAESKIAADYYHSKHHELLIEASKILDYTISGFIDYDAFQLGNMYAPAINNWLREHGTVAFDVYRGEDTRLHTPFFDFPFLMGLMASRKKGKLFRKVWEYRKILNHWPIRFGRNYLKYAIKKSTPHTDIQKFLLQSTLRFSLPDGVEKGVLYNQLLRETEELSNAVTMDDIHRSVIKEAFNIQYSEDNKNARMASVTSNSFFLMPFLNPNVVEVSNNIPYKQSASTAYVNPRKTRSKFFMADKIILRKLMKGKAPDALLFRRKTTAPNSNYIYDSCWDELFKPLICNYSQELIENVKETENKKLLNYYIKRLIECDGKVGNDWAIAWHGNTITGMIILMLMMQGKVKDAASLKNLLSLK